MLADLCAAAGVPGGYDPGSLAALAPLGLALPARAGAPPLRQLVCALAYNHRVAAHAPLVALAQAILAGDAAAALAAASHPGTTALARGSPADRGAPDPRHMPGTSRPAATWPAR